MTDAVPVQRFVVDSNALRSDNLRAYLQLSADNFAVIPDYVSMEAHSGDTLVTVTESMRTLCEFPRQVIILKGTAIICGLKSPGADLLLDFTDAEQTAEFPLYCRHLQQGIEGNINVRRQLLQKGEWARQDLGKLLPDALSIAKAMSELRTIYTKDELAGIRNRSEIRSGLAEKVLKLSMLLSALLHGRHPATKHAANLPELDSLSDTFLFRLAICTQAWVLDWLALGGVEDARQDRIRNDMVDVIVAAYATYFDGLITSDNRAGHTHAVAAHLLKVWQTSLAG